MEQNRAYRILQHLITAKLSSKQRSAIWQWLVSDRDIEAKDAAVRKIWDQTDNISDDLIQESLKNTHLKIKNIERTAVRRSFQKQLLRYAVILLLPLISGLTVWMVINNRQSAVEMVECYVPNGERRSIDLPDGSKVQVNAGSLFIYPKSFRGDKRTVYLVGEANFSVKKNEKKPFVVKAKSLNIEVIGTKFNVESYPQNDKAIVTLEQGAVKVCNEENPIRQIQMASNQQLTYYDKENRFVMSQVDASNYTVWTKGELYFNNKSLTEILASLERHYDIRFQVDPKINNSDIYTMRIRAHETIEEALNIFIQIADNNKIAYRRDDQLIYLYLLRKEVKYK